MKQPEVMTGTALHIFIICIFLFPEGYNYVIRFYILYIVQCTLTLQDAIIQNKGDYLCIWEDLCAVEKNVVYVYLL